MPATKRRPRDGRFGSSHPRRFGRAGGSAGWDAGSVVCGKNFGGGRSTCSKPCVEALGRRKCFFVGCSAEKRLSSSRPEVSGHESEGRRVSVKLLLNWSMSTGSSSKEPGKSPSGSPASLLNECLACGVLVVGV